MQKFNKYLKLKTTDDLLGIKICGSIKNVIARAYGMLDGMKLPELTKAMFITEALNDIKRLIKALVGNIRAILSFAGFGDLLLTCTSTKSRNFTFGKMTGENKSAIEGGYALKPIHKLVLIFIFPQQKNSLWSFILQMVLKP